MNRAVTIELRGYSRKGTDNAEICLHHRAGELTLTLHLGGRWILRVNQPDDPSAVEIRGVDAEVRSHASIPSQPILPGGLWGRLHTDRTWGSTGLRHHGVFRLEGTASVDGLRLIAELGEDGDWSLTVNGALAVGGNLGTATLTFFRMPRPEPPLDPDLLEMLGVTTPSAPSKKRAA